MMIQQYLRALDTLIGWVFVLTRVSFQNQCLLFVLAGICLRRGRCCYSPLKMASSYWVPGMSQAAWSHAFRWVWIQPCPLFLGCGVLHPPSSALWSPEGDQGFLYNFSVLSRPRGQVFLSMCKGSNSHLQLLTTGHCGAPHSKPPSSEVLSY